MADPIPMQRPPGLPGGGLPPGLAGLVGGGAPKPPGNVGPVLSPQTNPGNSAAAMQKLGIALKSLQEALPAIPMGSELHTKVLKITTDLSKELQESPGESPQLQIQQLLRMIQQASQQAPMAALSRMDQGGSAGAGPAMPPPGAGPLPPPPAA